MKKFLSIFLVLCLLVGLTACKEEEDERTKEIKQALKDCKFLVNDNTENLDLIEEALDLYYSNGNIDILLDLSDYATEVFNNHTSIVGICKPYEELDAMTTLMSEEDLDTAGMSVFAGILHYGEVAARVARDSYVAYTSLCAYYGVDIEILAPQYN